MGTLLLVHAHPDDEAISTGGVMMKARADGHRVVLVTATRGEVGEIYNMDEKATRPRLGDVRTKELENAARDEAVTRTDAFTGREDEQDGLDVLERGVDRTLHVLGERIERPLETW